MKKIIELISVIDENKFTSENVKKSVWDFATEAGRGVVLWAFRYALSGKEKSPDPFALSDFLGKKETIDRLSAVI